ncbi:MAG: glycosyltransferase [Pyrinomonadaceae bacterium]|nr:glycosyltransferase [Pyrinomonadaceae bacterium]
MRTLSELFDSTTVVVPILRSASREGEVILDGPKLTVIPLTTPSGHGLRRKLLFPFWLCRNTPILAREILRADAVHAPIPGDVGTIGMLLAFLMRKPLFVRYCGNWFVQKTVAERFWKWFMEQFSGGRNVGLATGGAIEPPSLRNPNIKWIFATSLTDQELKDCSAQREISSEGRVRLIIACNQSRNKGTGKVIESLPLILKDFPSATLDVVGDGESLADFKKMATMLKLDERIAFHGKVDHPSILRLLKQADLFCYPTASEGFPKVVLEALACGLPVVTTRVSVLPHLIKNGCGVLLVEPTSRAIAEAVREVLTDNERYHLMSTRAIETARQYSLESWRDTIGDSLRDAWGESLARCVTTSI